MSLDQSSALRAGDRKGDRLILLIISGGIILLLAGVVAGIFLSDRTIENWAENVLIALVTGGLLKLSDTLSVMAQLSAGRQVERLGNQLANAPPSEPPAPSS